MYDIKPNGNELFHYGIKGQKWGKRNYQYEDGTYTPEGKMRYFGTSEATARGGGRSRRSVKGIGTGAKVAIGAAATAAALAGTAMVVKNVNPKLYNKGKAAVNQFGKKAMSSATNLANKGRAAVSNLKDTVKNQKLGYDMATKYGQPDAYNNLGNALGKGVNAAKSGISKARKNVSSTAKSLAKNVTSTATRAAKSVRSKALNTRDNVINSYNAYNVARTTGQQYDNSLGGKLGIGVNNLQRNAGKIVNNINKTAKNVGKAVRSNTAKVSDYTRNTLPGQVRQLTNNASNKVQQLKAKITKYGMNTKAMKRLVKRK